MFTAHLEVETDAFGWTLLGLITVQLQTILHLHFLRGDYYLPFFFFFLLLSRQLSTLCTKMKKMVLFWK